MLSLEEKLKICNSCKDRSFNSETGLVCGKTGKKPEFVNTCYDYKPDENEINRQQARAEEAKNNPQISGFLAFFVYWSIPISILITLISHIINWNQNTLEGNPWAVLFEIFFLLFYCYFETYTIYGFVKRKPDAVFIAKYQLIVLAGINILSAISGEVSSSDFLSNPSRLISSSIWAVVFFIYLCVSEDVKYLIPKETRKLTGRNKILFILSLIIPIILYCGLILNLANESYGATLFSSDEKKIEAACKERQKEFPQEISEGLNWTDMFLDKENVVFVFKYTPEYDSNFTGWTMDYSRLFGLCQKELTKAGNVGSDDPLLGMCINSGHGIFYDYQSSEGIDLYSFTLTPEDLKQLAQIDYTYSTSVDDLNRILDTYNLLLPIDYFDGGKLFRCSFNENTMHYDITLTDTDMSTLSQMGKTELKNFLITYVLPYTSDAPFTLSQLNNYDLIFDFSADCSTWWNTSVKITAKEYNKALQSPSED